MAETVPGKLISELRVIDLKQELESRGLDKSGVKAALTDRLKKVLEAEGKDPDQYRFEITSKKMGDAEVLDEDNTAVDENSGLGGDDTAVLNAIEENGIELNAEGLSQEEEEILLKEETTESSEQKVDVKEHEEVKTGIADEKSNTAVSSESNANMEVKEEIPVKEILVKEETLTTSEVALKDAKVEAVIKQEEIKMELTNDDDKENVLSVADSFPPTPTSVKPLVEFTSEDTIKMDTSGDRKEDDISLIVHPDETLNEFEDLVSSASGTSLSTMVQEQLDAVAEKESDKPGVGENKESAASNEENTDSQMDDAGKESSINSESKTDSAKDESADNDATKDAEKSKSGDEKSEDKAKSMASSRNLWISGLNNTTRATDLKTLFSKYGKVAGAKVVTNARSPMSKCYGFVTMNTAEEASKCIQHLHRTELHGRMISVERAKADPSQTSKSSPSSDKKDDKSVEKRRDRDADRRHRGAHPERRRYTERGYRRHSASSHRSRSRERRHGDRERKKSDSKKDDKKSGDEKEKREEIKDEKKEAEKAEEKTGESKDEKKSEKTEKENEKKEDEKGEKKDEKKDGDNKDGERRKDDRKDRKSRDHRDMLSLEKIKEERERERQRLRERRVRVEERRRREELESDRIRLAQRHRREQDDLQRERDRLRIERERLEREKIQAERERLLFEREKRERERAELAEQRRLEALRYEERQRALKRPYDRPADDYWGEPKRAAYDSPPAARFSDFERDRLAPPRGAAAPSYAREPFAERTAPPRDRAYDRPATREPAPRFEDRREDRDRRDRDRDDRLPASDRYRYDNDRRAGGRDAVPSRDSRASDRHDTRRSPPHRSARDPSPRSRDKSRDSHRDGRSATERSYSHSSAGAGRGDSWAAPPARRSHDKDTTTYARASAASAPTINSASTSVDKHSAWADPGRVIVPAAAARPGGSQWVNPTATVPGRTILSQPVLHQPQHPAAGHPQFLISAANIISAGLGAGLAGAKPDPTRYGAAYNPPRRY